MATAFTRSLASQPGTQLQPIRDRTEGFALGVFDQTAAVVARFPRGRIDKPFRVNRGNVRQLLGKPGSISLSLLNEAFVQVYECLQRGAREVLVQRLSVPAAATSWVTFTSGSPATFAVVSTISGTAHSFAVRHRGCHNDGIRLRVHADPFAVSGVAAAATVITVKVLDADGGELHSFTGSLDIAATDDFGNSIYLPDVSAQYTDMLEWDIPTGKSIATTADAYGRDAAGRDKWATSTTLVAFAEGGTAYSTTDYDNAVALLRNAREDFGYIIGGGTRSVALITRLADLGFDTNRQFLFDIPGEFTPAAAITFAQSLGFGTLGRDHYPQAYWTPIKATDPVNGNPAVFGSSGAQAGYRCARNAITNAYGLAAKNTPIAGGRNGNLGRAGPRPVYAPTEFELSDLADAKINPVIFQTYTDGTRVVFSDVLTCAATVASYRKLVTVAEMSAHLDEAVCRYAREVLMLPQAESIQRMEAFLENLFRNALGSGWLVDTPDIPAYQYAVKRDPQRPADRLQVEYWLHYDGVTRQVYVQQNIV